MQSCSSKVQTPPAAPSPWTGGAASAAVLRLVKQQRLCLNLSRACFRRNSTGLKCSFYTCFSFSQKLINYSAENQKVNVFMTVNVLSMSWCKPLHQLILTVLMKEEIIYGDQTVSVHMGLTHRCLCWTVVELYISHCELMLSEVIFCPFIDVSQPYIAHCIPLKSFCSFVIVHYIFVLIYLHFRVVLHPCAGISHSYRVMLHPFCHFKSLCSPFLILLHLFDVVVHPFVLIKKPF